LDNTKRKAGRAGGPCFQLKNMNFQRAGGLYNRAGRPVAEKGGPTGYTAVRDGRM